MDRTVTALPPGRPESAGRRIAVDVLKALQVDPRVDPAFRTGLGDPEAAVDAALRVMETAVDPALVAFLATIEIMHDLTFAEMSSAGAIESELEHTLYRHNPLRWVKRTERSDPRRAAAWWLLIQAKQPPWVRTPRGEAAVRRNPGIVPAAHASGA